MSTGSMYGEADLGGAKVKLALSSRLRSFLIILGLCFFVVVMFVGGLILSVGHRAGRMRKK